MAGYHINLNVLMKIVSQGVQTFFLVFDSRFKLFAWRLQGVSKLGIVFMSTRRSRYFLNRTPPADVNPRSISVHHWQSFCCSRWRHFPRCRWGSNARSRRFLDCPKAAALRNRIWDRMWRRTGKQPTLSGTQSGIDSQSKNIFFAAVINVPAIARLLANAAKNKTKKLVHWMWLSN